MNETVHELNYRYLDSVHIPYVLNEWANDDVRSTVFLKSPLGTGKTTLIKQLISRFAQEKILIITPRITLAYMYRRELDQFGFVAYNDDDLSDTSSFSANKHPRFIVQLQSLDKFVEIANNPYHIQYDIVIFDEVHTTYEELSSKLGYTCPAKIMSNVCQIIRTVPRQLLCDAHLGREVIDFIKMICKGICLTQYDLIVNQFQFPHKKRMVILSKFFLSPRIATMLKDCMSKYGNFEDFQRLQIIMDTNCYKTGRDKIDLYERLLADIFVQSTNTQLSSPAFSASSGVGFYDCIMYHLLTDINAGKKTVVTCSKSSTALFLYRILTYLYGDAKRILCMTGKDDADEKKTFVENADDMLLDQDVFIYTGFLQVGVSIHGTKAYFDNHYVLFAHGQCIGSVESLVQCIGRIRNITGVYYMAYDGWIADERKREHNPVQAVSDRIFDDNIVTNDHFVNDTISSTEIEGVRGIFKTYMQQISTYRRRYMNIDEYFKRFYNITSCHRVLYVMSSYGVQYPIRQVPVKFVYYTSVKQYRSCITNIVNSHLPEIKELTRKSLSEYDISAMLSMGIISGIVLDKIHGIKQISTMPDVLGKVSMITSIIGDVKLFKYFYHIHRLRCSDNDTDSNRGMFYSACDHHGISIVELDASNSVYDICDDIFDFPDDVVGTGSNRIKVDYEHIHEIVSRNDAHKNTIINSIGRSYDTNSIEYTIKHVRVLIRTHTNYKCKKMYRQSSMIVDDITNVCVSYNNFVHYLITNTY